MNEAGIPATIGPLREHQVDTVARLRFQAFFEASDRTLAEDAGDLRGLLRDGVFETALVAEIGGAAVGSCLFIRSELEPAHDLTPWLAGLVVAPGWRGWGIGRNLVRAVEGMRPRSAARNSIFTPGRRSRSIPRLAGRSPIVSWTTARRWC